MNLLTSIFILAAFILGAQVYKSGFQDGQQTVIAQVIE